MNHWRPLEGPGAHRVARRGILIALVSRAMVRSWNEAQPFDGHPADHAPRV